MARACGAKAARGSLRQAREQMALWLRQGILPLSYYVFDLHRGDAPSAALDYLYRYETKHGIYPILRNTVLLGGDHRSAAQQGAVRAALSRARRAGD